MSTFLAVFVNAEPFFAAFGLLVAAVVLARIGWRLTVPVRDAARKSWNRWRVPQRPAPAPLPKRVPGTYGPRLPANRNHARIEELLRKAGDEIDRQLDAHFEPTAEQDAQLIAEAIRICRDAAHH